MQYCIVKFSEKSYKYREVMAPKNKAHSFWTPLTSMQGVATRGCKSSQIICKVPSKNWTFSTDVTQKIIYTSSMLKKPKRYM